MESPPAEPLEARAQKCIRNKRYYAANKERLLEHARQYWAENKEWLMQRRRARYKEHREEFKAKRRAGYDQAARAKHQEYYRRNRERILQGAREYHARSRNIRDAYRARNAKKIRATSRRWVSENKERMRELQHGHRLKWRDHPPVRIANCVRQQLYRWVKRGAAKPGSSETLLGCSFEAFLQYVECQFRRWMTWKNYGRAWHIDHIIPCSAFDLTRPEHVRQCFHFTNLRPMWARANLRKGAKITDPQLKLLL